MATPYPGGEPSGSEDANGGGGAGGDGHGPGGAHRYEPQPESAHEPESESAAAPESGPSSAPEEPGRGTGEHGAVKGPTDLPARSVKGVLKRTLTEFRADGLTDWAAALTYYGVLAVFPAMLALVSILGLLGSSAIQPLIDNFRGIAPDSVRTILTTALEQLRGSQDKAVIPLVVGIAVALWSASGYVAAFIRASNAVYDIGEGRPVWKTLPLRLGITAGVVVLLALTAIGVVFTGPLATKTGQALGLGDTALRVWEYAKWPVMVLLVALIIGLLYWAAPNVRRRFRWVTPGGLVAVVIWLVVSVLFALYVTHFGSYGKTYGSFAAPIVALVWLWISNLAILFGLEFNSELERGRAIEGGHPPGDEPYATPRDTRKL